MSIGSNSMGSHFMLESVETGALMIEFGTSKI
jgi:hypothetical protein